MTKKGKGNKRDGWKEQFSEEIYFKWKRIKGLILLRKGQHAYCNIYCLRTYAWLNKKEKIIIFVIFLFCGYFKILLHWNKMVLFLFCNSYMFSKNATRHKTSFQ